jgi:hypothetical protein
MRDKDMSDGSVNEQGRVDSKAMSLTSTCSRCLDEPVTIKQKGFVCDWVCAWRGGRSFLKCHG